MSDIFPGRLDPFQIFSITVDYVNKLDFESPYVNLLYIHIVKIWPESSTLVGTLDTRAPIDCFTKMTPRVQTLLSSYSQNCTKRAPGFTALFLR